MEAHLLPKFQRGADAEVGGCVYGGYEFEEGFEGGFGDCDGDGVGDLEGVGRRSQLPSP